MGGADHRVAADADGSGESEVAARTSSGKVMRARTSRPGQIGPLATVHGGRRCANQMLSPGRDDAGAVPGRVMRGLAAVFDVGRPTRNAGVRCRDALGGMTTSSGIFGVDGLDDGVLEKAAAGTETQIDASATRLRWPAATCRRPAARRRCLLGVAVCETVVPQPCSALTRRRRRWVPALSIERGGSWWPRRPVSALDDGPWVLVRKVRSRPCVLPAALAEFGGLVGAAGVHGVSASVDQRWVASVCDGGPAASSLPVQGERPAACRMAGAELLQRARAMPLAHASPAAVPPKTLTGRRS